MPETRLAAAVPCGRVRAWHARKFARSSRPRKEFGRVESPPHDRKIIEPSRARPAEGFLFWSFAFRRGFGSAPRHGRFGGSPEPETGASPAAAIFVFEILWAAGTGVPAILARSRFGRVQFSGRPPITGTNSRPSSSGKTRVCQSRNAVSITAGRSNPPNPGGVGSGERVRLISARERPDGLQRDGS